MRDHSSLLGTEAVPRLLVRLAAPATFALLMSAAYNLTDTIFLGYWVGSEAIAALAVSFSIQILLMAVAQTTGIGGASIISRSLGANDREQAEIGLGNAVSLSIGLSALIAVVCLMLLRPAARLIGATPEILPHFVDYMTVILIGSPFFVFAMTGNFLIRAEGDARTAMIAMALGSGLNIALDPVFIRALSMGTRGAALATILAQSVAAIFIALHYRRGRSGLRIRIRDLVPRLSVGFEIFRIGSGSFARMIAGSLTIIFLNRSLGFYGGTPAIAAYGVINRLLNMLLLPMFGVIQGMMPIVGYSYGARMMQRAREAVRLSICITTVFSVAVSVVLLLVPHVFMRIFTPDAEVISIGVQATRVMAVGLSTVGFQIVAGGMYQALGHALPAFILAVLRQVIVLIPLVFILPRFMGLLGIWASFPISDGLAAVVTAVMMARLLKAFRAGIDPRARLRDDTLNA